MACSGIVPGEDIVQAYLEMKKSKSKRALLIGFKTDCDKLYLMKESLDNKKTMEDFIQTMGKIKDGCYAIYDDGYKMLLIIWNPPTANLKVRFSLATTAQGLQTKLEGVGAPVGTCDNMQELRELLTEKLKLK